MIGNVFKIYLPIIALIFISFYVTNKFIKPSPKKELIIAAGSKNGTYYQTALEYKTLLEKDKVHVTVLETNGSIHNTKLLQEGKADIGFVQSGTLSEESKQNIQSLTSVYYEPLWIFYRNEGFQINYIIELIGKKISMGAQGSGTFDLSSKILKDNGINETNSTFFHYSTTQAKESLLKGDIDVLLTVISPKSSIVQELLEDPKINVLSIKRAKAYSRKYSYITTLKLYE